jgi:transposase InsO family protein
MNVFPFVEAEKAEQQGNVAKACELLEVSRSAYYCWSKHVPSRRQLADEELGERIEEIHAGSRGTYGWPRVHQQLRREAIHCSGKRVARIMCQRGLIGRCRRRWTKTTISDPEAAAVDLVKRAFGPGTGELDRIYVGDITYIWTWEGWLFCHHVLFFASPEAGSQWVDEHPGTFLLGLADAFDVGRRFDALWRLGAALNASESAHRHPTRLAVSFGCSDKRRRVPYAWWSSRHRRGRARRAG